MSRVRLLSPVSATLMLVAAIVALPGSVVPSAQLPTKFENLQVLPKDISRDALTQRMREFSFALNVRCEYCHAGGNGVSFQDVAFESDEKPAKRKARHMLRMVEEINGRLLTGTPDRVDPPVRVDCVTCHHGLSIPKTLATTLNEIIAKEGAPAAIARYRQLREETIVSGRYDFGEWSINELARALKERGDTASAISILEMNAEFYPKSSAIDAMVADLHLTRGDRDKAIARLKLALEKDPKNEGLRKRLAELEAPR